jgi:hypothetical protein
MAGNRKIASELSRVYELLREGQTERARTQAQFLMDTHRGSGFVGDSLATQFLDVGLIDDARRIAGSAAASGTVLDDEVMERLELATEDVPTSNGAHSFRKLKWADRHDPSRLGPWNPLLAWSVTIGPEGVEIKRRWSTESLAWGEIEAVELVNREIRTAYAASSGRATQKILVFRTTTGSTRIDVSSYRPEFANPTEIIAEVGRFAKIEESEEKITRRDQVIWVINSLIFVALLAGIPLVLERC